MHELQAACRLSQSSIKGDIILFQHDALIKYSLLFYFALNSNQSQDILQEINLYFAGSNNKFNLLIT